MRVSLITAAAFLLRLAHTHSIIINQPQPVEIFYQPVTPSTSNLETSELASISYNASSLESIVHHYTPPAAAATTNQPQTSHPLFRIFTNSPKGSTTVTSLASFNPVFKPILTLYLNADLSIFAASFSADPLDPPSSKDPASNLKVTIVSTTPGPAPKLNSRKPPVIDADGKEVPQVPEVEKPFFQKYWWVFALVALLAVTGGGGGGEK